MELWPFDKITQVPLNPENSPRQDFADITKNMDLIDISSLLVINTIRGFRSESFTGIVSYIFREKLKIEFKKDYSIDSVEFRIPYRTFNDAGLLYKGVDLLQNNMKFVYDDLNKNGIETKVDDLGFSASSIGAYFFSANFDGNIDTKLDAVTIYL
ncbi:hypothetical protein NO263_02750 [Gluconacetobacter entanii]|uniref:Uncharacterized protein n=3 Tax=Gluconacetobacter entanii TaxID=108528 RepID=A0ABT3K274_9PROT|nr:hypothetical protein [Gluconacetobacter entanii]MCW4589501.1 hypothetical protein [Gluconacetobacter entanii]MCW4593204.1 hypothetical protein [Gluconacetobacter entanii]